MMSAVCPDCEYARLEMAGRHLETPGVTVAQADALAENERCQVHRNSVSETVGGLKITVQRWEKFGENAGEFIGGKRTLAGPYRFGFDGSREVVIGKYRQWLHEEIKAQGQVLGKLRDLLQVARGANGLVLVCMEPEFGEVIARALRWMDSTEGRRGNDGRKDSAT